MTVNKIKYIPKYKFNCFITEDYKNDADYGIYIDENGYTVGDCFDMWGAAQLWVGDIGVEYNFCLDCDENASAIYKTEMNGKYAETDYSAYIHYEIDFNHPQWKDNLENAMCEAFIEFTK